MRTLFVTCALALSLKAARAQEDDTCTGYACDAGDVSDEGSLMQRSIQKNSAELVQEQVHRFPDFAKKIGDLAKGVPGLGGIAGIAKKAQDNMEEGQTFTLTALGETINNTLKMLQTEVAQYARRVEEMSNETSSGVASILARQLNVPVETLPIGPEFEMKANLTLAKATATWEMMQTSGQRAAGALAQGLTSLGFKDTAASFNQSVQAALQESGALGEQLKSLQELLANGEEKPEAMVQFSFGRQSVTDKLNKVLEDARAQVDVFPKSFEDAFTTLSEKVTDASNKALSEDSAVSVQAAFNSLGAQANDLSQGLASATLKLFDSVGRGVSAVSGSWRGASASVLPAMVLLLCTLLPAVLEA